MSIYKAVFAHFSQKKDLKIIKYPLLIALASSTLITDSAYVTRFRDQLSIYRDRIDARSARKTAQCNEDIGPFSDFMKRYFEESRKFEIERKKK